MIKIIICIVAVSVLSCGESYAVGSIYELGFRAIPSATSVTCGVFGMSRRLPRIGDSREAGQGFSPDPTLSRMLLLGTKGMDNYSTLNAGAVKWTCRNTGTVTPVNVKVFLNGSETYFLTTDSDTWLIGDR